MKISWRYWIGSNFVWKQNLIGDYTRTEDFRLVRAWYFVVDYLICSIQVYKRTDCFSIKLNVSKHLTSFFKWQKHINKKFYIVFYYIEMPTPIFDQILKCFEFSERTDDIDLIRLVDERLRSFLKLTLPLKLKRVNRVI